MQIRGRYVDAGGPACEACGHCYSLCPANAIAVEGAGRDGTASAPRAGRLVSPADLIMLLASRRSERRFTGHDVPAELIGELLHAGAQAPSGGNRRTIECLLLSRGEKRARVTEEIAAFYRRLATIASNRPARWLASHVAGNAAGPFLRDRAYRERFLSLVHELDMGEDPLFYDAPVVMLFHTAASIPTPEEDAVLVAYNVALAATTHGLGSCLVSMAQKAIRASRAVRRGLELPQGHRVLAVLVLGYPAIQRLRPVRREPIRVIGPSRGV